MAKRKPAKSHKPSKRLSHKKPAHPASRRPHPKAPAAPPAAPEAQRPLAEQGRVDVTRNAGYVTAVLRRPAAANRLTGPMAAALMDLAETVEDDDSVSLVIITGAGNSFCAGFEDDVDTRLVETLAAISKPTAAVVNGDALDEGLEMALAMDIRVALFSARFGLTQVKRGLLPRFGGTQRLPRLVGAANALKMLLTGELLDGREALRRGLVTYLADSQEQLRNAVGQLTTSVLGKGPLATRLAKEAILKGSDMTLDQGIRLEEDLYALLQTTADRAEGVRAFLEKRRPLFKGN